MALKEVSALFCDNLPYLSALCVVFKKPVFRLPLTSFARTQDRMCRIAVKFQKRTTYFSAFTVGTSFVTFSRLLNLSMPHFLHQYKENDNVTTINNNVSNYHKIFLKVYLFTYSFNKFLSVPTMCQEL